MPSIKSQSVASLDLAARESARSTIINHAIKAPEQVASVLVRSPTLCKGLSDFDHLVEVLIRNGQRHVMTQLADSPALGTRERTRLVEQLLIIQ